MSSQSGLNGARMNPGATAFTRMPRGASSHASTRVNPSTPALVAEYIEMRG
jgi:hypothetical protein